MIDWFQKYVFLWNRNKEIDKCENILKWIEERNRNSSKKDSDRKIWQTGFIKSKFILSKNYLV